MTVPEPDQTGEVAQHCWGWRIKPMNWPLGYWLTITDYPDGDAPKGGIPMMLGDERAVWGSQARAIRKAERIVARLNRREDRRRRLSASRNQYGGDPK